MKNNYLNVALIMGSGLIAGALNYAYYPLLLQYMSLEDFGIFGSIMGILNLIGVVTTGIVLFLNKEVSRNIENPSQIKQIYLSALLILSSLGLIGFIVFGLMSPLFAAYFNISEISYFWLVGISIIIALANSAIMATLRGMKKFSYLSCNQILSPILKLTVGVGFVYLGFSILGAIAGVIVSGVIATLISILYIHIVFRDTKKSGNTKELFENIKKNKIEVIHFFLSSLFFAILMNIDVILVQNIFDSSVAGAYVGVAVLGKFLIFLLLSIETVYYGQILEQAKDKIPVQLIRNPLVLMSVTFVGALVFNMFLGKYILHILKPELQEYVYIYIISLIYYGLLAYISFFSKILTAWGVFSVNKILTFLIVLLIILVYTVGQQSLEAFVYCFIAIALLSTICLGKIFFSQLNK